VSGKGAVRGKLCGAGQGGDLVSRNDQTRHIQVLQDEPADDPPGGDDVCPDPTLASKCGRSAARTRHRHQP